jgi:hypothetical protein
LKLKRIVSRETFYPFVTSLLLNLAKPRSDCDKTAFCASKIAKLEPFWRKIGEKTGEKTKMQAILFFLRYSCGIEKSACGVVPSSNRGATSVRIAAGFCRFF